MSPENRTAYTIDQAAIRVGRDKRTIKRWLADGLDHRKIGGHVYIGHDALLARWRKQMKNDPSRTRHT
ncbi:helix-turn-helix domain-containing protein [Leifsonia sp. LS1]|uniref:helix-turn-helix domain-containing protein n=1 Tax=Leifsonia sp. LS1 TaxID=2828483 RepID=UPI001CFD21C6|nr:helix-turn-helix domain-containing protein [Leifsonia sp. LS1]